MKLQKANHDWRLFEKTSCRLCESHFLESVLDLGFTPLADEFLENEEEARTCEVFPLVLNLCSNCGWLQTSVVVNPKLLYQRNYPYDSSITSTGAIHWQELARTCSTLVDGANKGMSLDIGANVGVLVKEMSNFGFMAFGIDPSVEATSIGKSQGLNIKPDFFNLESAKKYKIEGCLFDVITATNVFAHIDNLEDWLEGILEVLSDNGVLVIEAPHSLNLILDNQFDTIYHEHLSYVSASPLITFLKRFGLEIFRIQRRPIHGGSIRIFIARVGAYGQEASVQEVLDMEEKAQIHSLRTLYLLRDQVRKLRDSFADFRTKLNHEGRTLAAIGAPAKGMTFLNYMDLRFPELIGISDAAIQKQGKFAPGTGLRVCSDIELSRAKPDYVLILAWNFSTEILDKVVPIFSSKTKFLTAIPNLREV